MKKRFHLIPYTCGAGAQKTGCVAGAAAIQKFGLADYLRNDRRDVVWQENAAALYESVRGVYENLPPIGSKERLQIVLDQCVHVSNEVEKAVREGAVPVTIGGDHSMAAGSIAGFARATGGHGRIGLIWLDAHSDINTPRTSESQALHGMPVAALLGLRTMNTPFLKIGGGKRVIEPEHIVYAGLRDVDEMEKIRIKKHEISAFTMDQMKSGDGAFMQAVERVAAETDYLILSLDIDVLDPSVAPSVGSPVAHGFTREQLLKVLNDISSVHALDMIEIAEFNPNLPGAEQTYNVLRDAADVVLR